MKLFNLLLKMAQRINRPMRYIGNIYWGTGSWTAPADGFVNVIVVGTRESNYHLLYVADSSTNQVVGSVLGKGAGSQATIMFPVIKGKTYKTSYATNCSSTEAYYYKFGGN